MLGESAASEASDPQKEDGSAKAAQAQKTALLTYWSFLRGPFAQCADAAKSHQAH
jgi:hypothetical protein